MELNTRTVYSSYLQTCLLTKLPFEVKPYTTLNERFGILSGVLPVMGELPHLGFMTIGTGGYRLTTAANNKPKIEPIQHLATDAAAFDPIPFVLRLPTQDLTPLERSRYALRKEMIFNGTTYIAYYARRIDFTGVLASMEYRTIVNENMSTVTPFVPDNNNLYPTPQPLSNTGVNIITGESVAASAKITIPMSPWEIDELINVARVMYDDEDLAVISEIQLVSGVDKSTSVSGPSGSFVFNEVIAAQVISHVAAAYFLRYARSGIDLYLDIGASEPLWKFIPTDNSTP